ncbi:MAG: hypothetical protein AAGC43_00085 [Bacteroidota bacterium]
MHFSTYSISKTLLIVSFFLGLTSKAQEIKEAPGPIQEFMYSDLAYPFGKRNERAPEGLRQFGQFIGIWKMTTHALANGQWYKGWPSYWAWKYAVDGAAIQDYFYQAQENMPPNSTQQFDTQALNLRIYDMETNSWTITWIANVGKEHRYRAELHRDEIWMTPIDVVDTGQKTRVVFSNITKDSFKWRNERWDESSKKWVHSVYLIGERLK